ncbi:MAG TPA: PQQ-binding-like beta-propeller repeat protein, partial [Thermoplasmata archaeon]|nr:PQQ-binding-like beta-propeller repeat protein [Thermoplasmata archaeon]
MPSEQPTGAVRASRALHGALLAGASLAVVLLFLSSTAVSPSVQSATDRLPALTGAPAQAPAVQLPPGADSPTYLANNNRDIFGPQEKLINASSAASLRLLWSFNQTGALESEPVTSAGVVYVGSTSGYEYALSTLTGQVLWQSYLGVDVNDTLCGTTALGIVSTPTVSGNTLLVFGGNAVLYDLNKESGKTLWQLALGNTSQGYFGWGSPLVIGADAFIGAASRCDKPLVPGGLYEVSLTTHKEIAFFNTTSPGLVGNSIWSTPSYNPST